MAHTRARARRLTKKEKQEKAAISKAMTILGRRTSEKKAAAARRNGRLGDPRPPEDRV